MERLSRRSHEHDSVPSHAEKSWGSARCSLRKHPQPRPAALEDTAQPGVVASPGLHPRGLAVVEATWMQHAGLHPDESTDSDGSDDYQVAAVTPPELRPSKARMQAPRSKSGAASVSASSLLEGVLKAAPPAAGVDPLVYAEVRCWL